MIRRFVLTAIFLSILFSGAGDVDALSSKCDLAERLYLEGDHEGAAYESERLFNKYSTSEFKNDVAFLAGLSFLKLENYSKAKKYFDFVIYNSDDPQLVDEAHVGLANIPKESPPAKKPDFYSVQVGSFKNKRNANRLYKRFKRRRYTVRVIKEDSKKGVVHKVKIGKFRTKKSAVRFARKLRREGYPTAIVPY